jgi:hypothetical protein
MLSVYVRDNTDSKKEDGRLHKFKKLMYPEIETLTACELSLSNCFS